MDNRPDGHSGQRFDCEQCQQLHDLFAELDFKKPHFTQARQAIVDLIDDHVRWQHSRINQREPSR